MYESRPNLERLLSAQERGVSVRSGDKQPCGGHQCADEEDISLEQQHSQQRCVQHGLWVHHDELPPDG